MCFVGGDARRNRVDHRRDSAENARRHGTYRAACETAGYLPSQVSILLYAVSPDARVVSVSVDGLDAAVCFVGGDARRNRVDHLVLGEAACDALKGAVQGYPADNVHAAAGPSLAALKADIDFFERFEKGRIGIPQKERQWREEKGAGNLVYLHIIRNAGVVEGDAARGNHRNAPFVMKVSDMAAKMVPKWVDPWEITRKEYDIWTLFATPDTGGLVSERPPS